MQPTPPVVAVVRDPHTRNVIEETLGAHGIRVCPAADVETGWELLRHARTAAILVEEALAGAIHLLDRIANDDPGARVILLAENYNDESAVEVVRHGACACLGLPVRAEALWGKISELLAEVRTRSETLELDERLLEACQFHGMVGRSPCMLEIFTRIRRVAPHYRVALITGGTGTGKELVAQALHALSPVSHRGFAVCNCSAIVETLFESELFGHVRGAFTGATQDRVGLFEYAQGGTVFLDEIADMPLATQSKLLRVVQNHELQRVGSPEVRKVDVRVIAATNRDVRMLVSENLFREDLYYRLCMVELEMPALAERKEDLALLQRHFVQRFSQLYGKRVSGLSRRAQAVLAAHHWRGNVRELENVIGHACMLTESDFIDLRDLPAYLRGAPRDVPHAEPDLMPLAAVERRYVQHVLEHLNGNKVQAAQALGISRATLYRILRDLARQPEKPWSGAWSRNGSPPRLRIQ